MRTKNIQDTQLDFLVSAMSHGNFQTTDQILSWMKSQNEEVVSNIMQIPISELRGWSYRDDRIRHNSGKFFSIDGIHIRTNYRNTPEWDQPIINQPEIGFLGFIVKKFNGVLHFLLQAKIEPGNLNIVQLSPTLQATRSNYTRVHGGKAPTYLEYFNGEKDVLILVDQLQSEQGARFLHKRNRNIIVEVGEDEELEVKEGYIWASLGQIKELLRYPNVVNMDSRTVISCINFGSYSEHSLRLLDAVKRMNGIHSSKPDSFLYSVLSGDNHLNELQDIIQWITSLKFKYELDVTPVGISEMKNWIYDGDTIHHESGKYFDVMGCRVEIGNREVVSWDQPMVRSAQEGLMGFIVKKINGIYHFLVQAKLESGNFDIVEMAPTVQCLTGNYRKGKNEYTIPYLEQILNAPKDKIWYSSYQSEEGGRFFQEQNLNIIVEVGEEFPIEVEENYCWLTLNQMLSFVTYNNYLNIAARSLLSAISFY
ncbi:NDP-hexose 2,3-dehydratase family protein [Prevotella copri]|uniref:NDP-hexose 2,3-dehydratase family protein n=1 Tax=Segatella copri TaxID=165179 RepID=A0AAW5UA67_9BACT|nr:NDP-hexose 2,3-dehydratase family protein [Segatella copri]MCW4100196.1 NDP-hexose 2,3-dehydratase family protein [Segatella copri]MCW4133037.1 NDP-hexose 2,3-dehydratase family protein [Segatella copri]MCW4163592.1 NDP-hexose 2,3-dehydratase family protein [Segatella copri]